MTKSRQINKPRTKLTIEIKNFLLNHYANNPTWVIAEKLNLTNSSIYNFANRLGLKKSSEFYKTHASGRIMPGQILHASGRFAAGQTPWNKGMKGLQIGGEQTQFKKGQTPHNTKPIGHMRKTKDGYYEVKVTERTATKKAFIAVHRLVWERMHGKPVPKNCVITYLDGNYENYDISNLKCITKTENSRRNSPYAYGKDIGHIAQLRGQITRQINKQRKMQNDNRNHSANA